MIVAACSSGGSGGGSSPDPKTAPLTGADGGSGVDLDRRALGFKIDNTPPAIPQSGVESADLIYEEVVEGGLTRLLVVFQSQNADSVGPIRSVRPVDPKLIKGLGNAVLIFSGGQPGVLDLVKQSGVTTVSPNSNSGAFKRESGRSSPHNLYSSTGDIYGVLSDKNGAPPELATFGNLPSDMKTAPATKVDVVFERTSPTVWTYNSDAGKYERQFNGAPEKVASGATLQIDNLVFQQVESIPTSFTDENNQPVPNWKVVGQGKLWVARDGKIVTGTWNRSSETGVAKLTDESGNEIPLHTGNTWWSLVPAATGSVTAS